MIESLQMVLQSEDLASNRPARSEDAVSSNGATYVVQERKGQFRGFHKSVSLVRDNFGVLLSDEHCAGSITRPMTLCREAPAALSLERVTRLSQSPLRSGTVAQIPSPCVPLPEGAAVKYVIGLNRGTI